MMTLDLFENLQDTWQTLCECYDVTSDLPTVGALFADADPSTSDEAAQIVLINMLSEIMECVGRFSPWYKRPALAFGIIPSSRDGAGQPHWVLTSAALQSYESSLDRLAAAIEHNLGVILATQFVDNLDLIQELVDPCRLAACRCTPPRTILVHDIVIATAEIICDACQEPFALAGNAPGANF